MAALTTEEARLVADAVASGRVRRIPAGVSSLTPLYRWDGVNLVVARPAPGITGFHFGQARARLPAARPELSGRDRRIAELIRKGMTRDEIRAAMLGVSNTMISRVAGREGLKVARPPTEDAAVTRRIAELADGTRSITQIAAEAGCSRRTVKDRVRKHGLQVGDGRQDYIARQRAEAAVLDGRIAALADGRRPVPEIAKALGCSRYAVRERRSRLGLDIPDGLRGVRR